VVSSSDATASVLAGSSPSSRPSHANARMPPSQSLVPKDEPRRGGFSLVGEEDGRPRWPLSHAVGEKGRRTCVARRRGRGVHWGTARAYVAVRDGGHLPAPGLLPLFLSVLVPCLLRPSLFRPPLTNEGRRGSKSMLPCTLPILATTLPILTRDHKSALAHHEIEAPTPGRLPRGRASVVASSPSMTPPPRMAWRISQWRTPATCYPW
jgi:hypothetical protein